MSIKLVKQKVSVLLSLFSYMRLVAQSCPTLCHPVDYSQLGSSVHRDSPGKNTGVGCHSLLQVTFPTWGSNPALLHCRQILYHLATREAHEYWSGQSIPSLGDLPDPGIEPGFPALQADSLSAELPRICHLLKLVLSNFHILLNFSTLTIKLN